MKVKNNDPVAVQMLQELEELRWKYLGLLGDRAEDEGDFYLAEGYRWLARYKRWPREAMVPNTGESRYLWYLGIDISRDETSTSPYLHDSEDLPRILDAYEGYTHEDFGDYCRSSLPETLFWAATHIGKWLEEKVKRSKEEAESA